MTHNPDDELVSKKAAKDAVTQGSWKWTGKPLAIVPMLNAIEKNINALPAEGPEPSKAQEPDWKAVVGDFLEHQNKKIKGFEKGLPDMGSKAQDDMRTLYVPLLTAINEFIEELIQTHTPVSAGEGAHDARRKG